MEVVPHLPFALFLVWVRIKYGHGNFARITTPAPFVCTRWLAIITK